MLTGRVKTGAIAHDIVAGGDLFLRSVQQPGFYTVANPYDPSGIVQDGAVYTYLGAENIYQPHRTPVPNRETPSSKPARAAYGKTATNRRQLLQDRIELPGRIQLIAGGRYDALRDHNYSAYASCTDFTVPAQLRARANRQASLAAAIRSHLQPGREPHSLLELWRTALAGAAGALVGR